MDIKILGGIRQVFAFEVVLDFLLELAINFFPINFFFFWSVLSVPLITVASWGKVPETVRNQLLLHCTSS